MQAVQGHSLLLQLRQVCDVMKMEDQRVAQSSPIFSSQDAPVEGDSIFVKYILAIKTHYHTYNPRHFECVRKLQIQHPDWIIIEFLKATPPSHLNVEKLKSLFALVSRVYMAANRLSDVERKTKDDQSQELAIWLYDILKQLELLEAKQRATSSMLKSAGGSAAAALAVAFFNPWVAPAVFLFGSSLGLMVSSITSGEPFLLDRKRTSPLEFIILNDYVRYAFEPSSSGIYGRYVVQIPSHTLGEVHIDLQGEPITCHFNLNAKHKIDPADVQKLHLSMLRRLREQTLTPKTCLSILEALTTRKIPRGAKNPSVPAFLDADLSLCLDDIKLRAIDLSKSVIVLPALALLPATILDVPTYQNSCGLYALALGSLRAHKSNALVPNQIPEYILGWDESWLLSTNHDPHILAEIHRLLRKEMAETLNQDQDFKTQREEGFASACLNAVCNEGFPSDMEALVKSNQAFLSRLTNQANLNLYGMTAEELSLLLDRFKSESTHINATDISRMKEMIASGFPLTFDTTMDSFYGETIDPVDRMIKQRKLFSVTWMLFPTLQQRQLWCNMGRKWLEKKLFELMSLSSANQKVYLLKLFGVLLSVNFEGNGNSHTVAHVDFIQSQILHLLIGNQVRAEWHRIFANYLYYIKNQPYMFSADELIALAQKWQVDLEIYEWSKKEESIAPSSGRLRVRLTNPTYIHWQVYSH